MTASNSARISPTAHFISYLKYRGGLGGPELTSGTGRLIHHLVWPMLGAVRLLGGLDAERVVVARHRGLDHFLAAAIESGEITQVIELAAGLSPRGREFARRYAERGLIYIEGDLPGIIARKREALGSLAPGHQLVELDALLDAGPTSLVGVGERWLDPASGTAVIYEGLTPYLDREANLTLWRRIGDFLSRYASGQLFTEVYFTAEVDAQPLAALIRGAFAALTRGRLYFPFEGAEDIVAQLERAGYGGARVQPIGELLDELQLDGDPNNMPVHLVTAAVVMREQP